MPVRSIPKNYRSVTGRLPSSKSEKVFFESTLERDFCTLLDFDPAVQIYDTQPLVIDWIDSNGKSHTYTPDALVTYHKNQSPFGSAETILFEVKYCTDIKDNWADYKPKFKAAIRESKKRGWRFKLLTENEIRTTYTVNARFLLPYLRQNPCPTHEQLLLTHLAFMRESSIEALLISIFNDKWAQAELIPSLWNLVARREILTDLNQPLVMASRIWVKG